MVALGQKISELAKFKTNLYWVFIIGLIIYYLLAIIPIIGGFVKLLALMASFGAALKNKKAFWAKASKAKML